MIDAEKDENTRDCLARLAVQYFFGDTEGEPEGFPLFVKRCVAQAERSYPLTTE